MTGSRDPRPPSTSATIAASPVIDAQPLVEAVIRRGDSPHTRRAYAGNLQSYANWLVAEGLAWATVTADDLDRYREWLARQYVRTTANRRLVVVRALCGEARRRRLVADDPPDRLRGVRACFPG